MLKPISENLPEKNGSDGDQACSVPAGAAGVKRDTSGKAGREKTRYVPDAGDIIWLEFNPQAGHEQAGHRPAVVLSPAAYNGPTGLLICCPTTTQIKNYPFEVPLSGSKPSVALADQIKSLDWQARRATRKGRASAAELEQIRQKSMALLRG